jgi:hypothetical protein
VRGALELLRSDFARGGSLAIDEGESADVVGIDEEVCLGLLILAALDGQGQLFLDK